MLLLLPDRERLVLSRCRAQASDWMAWVIPGPIVTSIVTSFVFYMYGPVWSVGVCAVLIAVDAFALYVNA